MEFDKDQQGQSMRLTEDGGLKHLRRTDYKMVLIIVCLTMVCYHLISVKQNQKSMMKILQQQLVEQKLTNLMLNGLAVNNPQVSSMLIHELKKNT